MRDLNKIINDSPSYKKSYTTSKKVHMNYICKSEGHTLGELLSDKEDKYRVCEVCKCKILEKNISSKDRIEKPKILIRGNRKFL